MTGNFWVTQPVTPFLPASINYLQGLETTLLFLFVVALVMMERMFRLVSHLGLNHLVVLEVPGLTT